MWLKIIVFSLVTVVFARNVQYTDEDARRDILSIINYAFGVKTVGRVGERNEPVHMRKGGRIEDIGSRVTPSHSINNESKSSRTNLHKHIERPIERNFNPRLKTSPRSNQHSGKETFNGTNERGIIYVSPTSGNDVNTSREQSSSQNFKQPNDKRTEVPNINNKTRRTEENTSKVALNKINTTPSTEIFDFTIINEVKQRNRDFKTNTVDSLNLQSHNLTQNVISTNVQVRRNHTEDTLQNAVTTKSKEATVQPQSKEVRTKKVDEDRWIWDDGITTTPAPDVGDRAAFAADKCPTGQVKFGNKCIEED